jgi:hypothetical protein
MTFNASFFSITTLSHQLVYSTRTDEAQQAGQPEAPMTREIVMAGTGDATKGPPKQKVTDIVSTLRPVKVWPLIRLATPSKCHLEVQTGRSANERDFH